MIEKHDLPCPFCGSDAYCYCYEEHPEKPIYVSCSNCDCDMPLEQWNMRHQPEWKNEPTEEGWYWVFDPEEKWRSPLCWIEKLSRPVESGEPVCWWMREAVHGDSDEWQPRMRCCGPLQMPKEPEV